MVVKDMQMKEKHDANRVVDQQPIQPTKEAEQDKLKRKGRNQNRVLVQLP